MNLNHKKKACLPNRQALAIILLLIVQAISFAQNRNTIDSLKSILAKTSQDTTKIHAYLDLSWEYKDYNLDTALFYSGLALNKSLTINYKKGIADAYRQKGVITILLNDYKQADSLLNIAITICRDINYQYGILKCYLSLSANACYKGNNRLMLEYCMKALKIAEKNNFIEDKAKILGNIGLAYVNLGDYDKAIEYGLDALKMFEECGNKIDIAKCNTNIGLLFIKIEEPDKALKYMNEALKLFIELKHIGGQISCFTNIGNVYKNLKKYDEALQNHNKALEISEKNNNLRTISDSYANIGNIYYKLEKYNKATEYYNKSLEIKEQISDKMGIAICYSNIANIEIKQKNYKIAEEYCLKSVELFEQNKELYNQQKTLEQLAIIYKLTGKYKKAYNTYFEAIAIKDSLFNIEKVEKIAQLEEKYLNEKLEKQNLILIYENEIQQSKINHHEKTHRIYFIMLFLTITAITIILVQYRKKNNAYKFLVSKNLDLLSKEKELKNIREKLQSCDTCPKNGVSDDERERILKKIIRLFDVDKIYIKTDLTLNKLAKRLSTNRTYLSQIINDEFEKNYSEFINEYRVNEAIHMFSDYKRNNKFSIEAIAKEAGFKTKTSFNSVFKKFTGITPSVFKDAIKFQ